MDQSSEDAMQVNNHNVSPELGGSPASLAQDPDENDQNNIADRVAGQYLSANSFLGRSNNLADYMGVTQLRSPYDPSTNSLQTPFYLHDSSPPQTPTRPQKQISTPGAPTSVTRQFPSQRNPSESPTPAFRQTLRDEYENEESPESPTPTNCQELQDEDEDEESRTALKRVAKQLSFLNYYTPHKNLMTNP